MGKLLFPSKQRVRGLDQLHSHGSHPEAAEWRFRDLGDLFARFCIQTPQRSKRRSTRPGLPLSTLQASTKLLAETPRPVGQQLQASNVTGKPGQPQSPEETWIGGSGSIGCSSGNSSSSSYNSVAGVVVVVVAGVVVVVAAAAAAVVAVTTEVLVVAVVAVAAEE